MTLRSVSADTIANSPPLKRIESCIEHIGGSDPWGSVINPLLAGLLAQVVTALSILEPICTFLHPEPFYFHCRPYPGKPPARPHLPSQALDAVVLTFSFTPGFRALVHLQINCLGKVSLLYLTLTLFTKETVLLDPLAVLGRLSVRRLFSGFPSWPRPEW